MKKKTGEKKSDKKNGAKKRANIKFCPTQKIGTWRKKRAKKQSNPKKNQSEQNGRKKMSDPKKNTGQKKQKKTKRVSKKNGEFFLKNCPILKKRNYRVTVKKNRPGQKNRA